MRIANQTAFLKTQFTKIEAEQFTVLDLNQKNDLPTANINLEESTS